MFQTVRKTVLKGVLFASLIAAVALPVSSVFAAGDPNSNTLKISGSTTVYPVVQVSITRFPNTVPGAVLNVSQGGSGVGKADILNGVDDIAMSSSGCKAGTDDATTTYKCNQLTDTVLARDAVSIIINNSVSCVSNITKADIIGIYQGTITTWNQLSQGGSCAATAIVPVAREIGSGTRQSLCDMTGVSCTATGSGTEQGTITARGVRVNGSPAMEADIDANPSHIGYVGLHFIGGNNHALSVSFQSGAPYTFVAPSDATVADNSYPMSRNLHLYSLPTSINNKALIGQYLTWILQPEAQAIVKDEGYLNIGTMAPDYDINLDHTVDIADIAVIGVDWGKTNAVPGWIRSDANYDGVVDIADVAYVGLNWGKSW